MPTIVLFVIACLLGLVGCGYEAAAPAPLPHCDRALDPELGSRTSPIWNWELDLWGQKAGLRYRSVVGVVTFGVAVCTGTLIDPRTVLTAAHCVCRTQNATNCASEAEVHPWWLDNQNRGAPIMGRVSVRSDFAYTPNPHGGWDPRADIALILLPEELVQFAPIPLAQHPPNICQNAVMAGIGGTGRPDWDGSLRYDFNTVAAVTPELIQTSVGVGIEKGDSGGPLLVWQNGQLRVAGVGLWGGQNNPTGYTNVAAYRAWAIRASRPGP